MAYPETRAGSLGRFDSDAQAVTLPAPLLLIPVPRPLLNPFISDLCPIIPLNLLIIKAMSDTHVANSAVSSQALASLRSIYQSDHCLLVSLVPCRVLRGQFPLDSRLSTSEAPVLSPWPPLLSPSLGDSIQALSGQSPA